MARTARPSLLTFAFLLTACGGPNSKDPPTSESSGEATETETTTDPTEESEATEASETTGAECFAAEVTEFQIREGDGKLQLDWTNPTDADFLGVQIQARDDGTVPESIDDGMTVYAGSDATVLLEALVNDSALQFRIFAESADGAFSCEGVADAGTPNPPWIAGAALPTARTDQKVVASATKVFALGGTTDCTNDAYVDVYDPGAGTWAPGTTGAVPMGGSQAAVVDGKAYSAGTTQMTEFDLDTESWTNCGGSCAAPPLANGVAAAAHGGKVYLFGGFDSGASANLATVSEFDPGTNSFTNCGGACADMPTARRFFRAHTIGDRIYTIAGFDGTDQLALVEEYDPTTNTWTNCGGTCAPIPLGRSSYVSAVVDEKIYVFGDTLNSESVSEYDPATNAWTAKSPMPLPRFGGGAATLNGDIYVVGGRNACCCGGHVDAFETYTPARDW